MAGYWKWITTALIGIVCSVTLAAHAQDWIDETFDDPDLDNWNTGGAWTFENGIARTEQAGAYLLAPDTWADMTLKVSLRRSGAGAASAVFRVNTDGSYAVSLSADAIRVWDLPAPGDDTQQPVALGSLAVPVGEGWHVVTVIAQGARAIVMLDRRAVFDLTSLDESGGAVGVIASGTGVLEVEELIVEPVEGTLAASPPRATPTPLPPPPTPPPTTDTIFDLKLMGIYVDGGTGPLLLDIRNNGPDALQGTITGVCQITNLEAEEDPVEVAFSLRVDLPADSRQTYPVDTLVVDAAETVHYAGCYIDHEWDRRFSNNIQTAFITPPGLAADVRADLVIRDLYLDTLPQGRLLVDITNNGPDDLVRAPVLFTCYVQDVNHEKREYVTSSPDLPLVLTLDAGQTITVDTTLTIDTDVITSILQCSIITEVDADPANNRFETVIPPLED